MRARAGFLAELTDSGLLETADVQVADRLGALTGETGDSVLLALALTVRAVRTGSVCLDVRAQSQADDPPGAGWPEPDAWLAQVRASQLVARQVLHVEGDVLYLDRYWREECLIASVLTERVAAPPPPDDRGAAMRSANLIFDDTYIEQRAACLSAIGRWTALVTGGPGTGKTTAVAGLLAVVTEQAAVAGRRIPRIALCAPTGKATARLAEAVRGATSQLPAEHQARIGSLPALTLHRLLGWKSGSRTRFKHDRSNPLPYDLIVVDETSMVSLTMMARLLEAVRPDCRLVLVGDPDQLSSVEAGAVLADLVAGFGELDPGAVTTLRTSHRFGPRIADLAEAIRVGDDDSVITLLATQQDGIEWLDPLDPGTPDTLRRVAVQAALRLGRAAESRALDEAVAALDQHRLLCAHRDGPYGAAQWNRLVERWLGEETGTPVGSAWGREWYPGRPVMVTSNDYGLGLFNGDTGLTIRRADGLRVAMSTASGPSSLATARLSDLETVHALTIHKSQGSQAREVTVILPDEESRLLSRELLYTAVTRAQDQLRLVGTEEVIRRAVRTRAQRASGLRERLQAPASDRGGVG